jgi:hypothetical protein
MGQRNSEPSVSDSIDEFFDPILSDAIDEVDEAEEPRARGKHHLAALRRRAEEKLEERRMREELGYIDLDWEEA